MPQAVFTSRRNRCRQIATRAAIWPPLVRQPRAFLIMVYAADRAADYRNPNVRRQDGL